MKHDPDKFKAFDTFEDACAAQDDVQSDSRGERFLREQNAADRREERAAYHTSLRAARKWCDQYEVLP